MKKRVWKRVFLALGAALLLTGLSGCSREELNRQLAESLGTLGLYENNEPVESPKMKAERELREKEEARESERDAILERAREKADIYDYSAALDTLDEIDEDYQEDEAVVEAKIEYQQKLGQMEDYQGDIAYLCFSSVIVDTDRAFDGDGNASTYNMWSVTVDELNAILEFLYENNYVLIDVHETISEVEDEEGNVTYIRVYPQVPEGKTPLIISQEGVNYYSYTLEDGFAQRLVLDDDGNVKALYVDENGTEQIGNYDLIPILDAFVEAHPDFSLRGARGIVSLTGYEGAYGYRIQDTESETLEEDRAAVQAIGDRLVETGWEIASSGYSHSSMSGMTYEELVSDTDSWMELIGAYAGSADILLFPFGDEVEFPGDKLSYLLDNGFRFFCGLWGNEDYLSVQSTYVRQTRRNVSGYIMHYYPEYLEEFFDVSAVLDGARPAFE